MSELISGWPNWPLMALDLWRKEIGYSPWHFWGLADSTIVPVTSKCNDVVREYGWQGTDEAGRSDIRSAMFNAEQVIFNNVGYWPAPAYSKDTLPWPRYQDQRLQWYRRTDVRGGYIPVMLNEGKIRDIGVEALELIQAAAPLVFTDNDGDGLKEDWMLAIPTTVDASEIAVYFTDTDRIVGDASLSARWRIEPVSVMRSGVNVYIIGKRWLVVKPELYEDKNNYPIDPTVDANFAASLDVYRRYTKTTGVISGVDSQAALIWESKPCTWGSGGIVNSSDPYSEGWVAARAGIRNADAGIVVPAEAVYDAVSGSWSYPTSCYSCCGEPDRVLLRYKAGYPLEAHGWMDPFMSKIVARLSAAEMSRRICACDQANREWSNWQFDVSRVNSPETYQINLDTLSNPLGTRRGHIYAWSQFKQLARVVGFLS